MKFVSIQFKPSPSACLLSNPSDLNASSLFLSINIAENTRLGLVRPHLNEKSLFYKLLSKAPNKAKTISGSKLHQLLLYAHLLSYCWIYPCIIYIYTLYIYIIYVL